MIIIVTGSDNMQGRTAATAYACNALLNDPNIPKPCMRKCFVDVRNLNKLKCNILGKSLLDYYAKAELTKLKECEPHRYRIGKAVDEFLNVFQNAIRPMCYHPTEAHLDEIRKKRIEHDRAEFSWHYRNDVTLI